MKIAHHRFPGSSEIYVIDNDWFEANDSEKLFWIKELSRLARFSIRVPHKGAVNGYGYMNPLVFVHWHDREFEERYRFLF